MNLMVIHLFHIFFVGTLFLYVGFQRNKVPSMVFPLLTYLGIFVILYHSYKTYIKIQKKQSVWINLFHLLLIGPLLIYIGIHGINTPQIYFELLKVFGFISIGYHGYCLLKH